MNQQIVCARMAMSLKETRQKAIDLDAYRSITTTVPPRRRSVMLGVGISKDGGYRLAAVGTINQGRGRESRSSTRPGRHRS